MRIAVFAFVFLGLGLRARGEPEQRAEQSQEDGLIGCAFEDNALTCLATRMARDLDRIETRVSGKKSEVPISAAIEQAGNFVAEVLDEFANPAKSAEIAEKQEEGEGQEEGRGKKIGKKKQKQLQKLIGLAMLFKAKLSLLLQLISTHFQLKFFAIAILSLVINAARFWLDLKKAHPAKVIYYEHAQHQHHYDHDDHDHGYWGRSSSGDSQDLAYAGYAPNGSR